ncbi:MAG: divalent-cation tolerance protein CutA [Spirochaetes bacterium]|nr:divalent-cation tolerance protein CutA [Spirochaetota bacterium]
MTKIIFVTSKVEESEVIASTIVKEKLAACANIVPRIKSIYWWQEKMENDEESLIIFKTNDKKIESLIKRVKQIHSYDVPEIIAMNIEEGNHDYLRWISEVIT